MILGLMSSESFRTYWSNNARRRIFYTFPQGAAPLMALLSLIEPDFTDKPDFAWWEKRLTEQQCQLANIDADSGPFSTTGTDTPLTEGGWGATINTVIRVRTIANGTDQLRINNTVWLLNVPTTTTGVVVQLYGQVTSIVSTSKFEMRLLEAVTGTTTLNDQTVGSVDGVTGGVIALVMGSAYGEGVVNNSGEKWTPPIKPDNYTQIFRTKFSFPRTALKPGTNFDKEGIYKDKAKEASLRHLMDLEKAALWGTKTAYSSNIDGDDTITRTTGGIYYWLRQWEAQYSIFRGGDGTASGPAAVTSDSDPDKRIITNANGYLTLRSYAGYLERVFRQCNNKSQEKLVLCGSGFLEVINQMYAGSTCLNSNLPMEETYGMNVVRHQTPHGLVYYKSHPLFNIRGSQFNNAAMILDIHNVIYRPLNDSDTQKVNRSLPNADKRVDEWITEYGLELRSPESHMLIQNVQNFRRD